MVDRNTLLAVALVAALAGCTVGPDFKAPKPQVPGQFAGAPDRPEPARPDAGGAAKPDHDVDPDPTWWREFQDRELDALEARTEAGNLDLQTSLVRILQARLQVQIARSQGLPMLNASASYSREQLGVEGILKSQGSQFGGTSQLNPAIVAALTKDVNLYQVGFDASWELDLFGKVRRSVEQAKAQVQEAVESRRDMLVSLQAEVATNYLQLRSAQSLRSITTELIANARNVLDLTQSRQVHGLAQQSDVESARAQVSSLQSQLPQYEAQIAVSRHAIAVLTGEEPEALDSELAPVANLPGVPPRVPVGLPASLARRRPDIRQAEATLHAATAGIGVSVASLYPDVSLTGTFGLRNTSTNYLFDWASRFYTAGPAISLPIFQGGALVANVKIARADAAAATLNYRKTVLTALQEVEDGLVSLDQDSQRLTALQDTVAADGRAFDIATHSYEKGLSTYIAVLNVQVQRDQARLQLAQASLAQLTDLVKLYKALAGGWDEAPAAQTADVRGVAP